VCEERLLVRLVFGVVGCWVGLLFVLVVGRYEVVLCEGGVFVCWFVEE